ncbi:hypothetical protein BSKO_00938 [Bryopsis sp. KO-2023]|nr:hypothetical protein BSKO_00938 [Bryopsis sp. KO-2023]
MTDRCQFLLRNKNRTCRFMAKAGHSYCGIHLFELKGEGAKRVPCPLDPAHTVLESELKTHIKKCNKRREQIKAESLPTYCQDMQAGSDDEPELPQVSSSIPPGRARTESRIMHANSLGATGLMQFIRKVEAVWDRFCSKPLAKNELRPTECEPYMKSDGWRPFSKKHAVQQASLIGNMMEAGMFSTQNPVVVEFGAGRGYLSSMIADATNSKVFYLLDTAGPRLKADRSLRQTSDVKIQRLRSDIKHFDVTGIPEIGTAKSAWIGCGKHLCGAATDFTLRASLSGFSKQANSPEMSQGGNNLKGIAVATCCHHRCGWKSYVGKKLFREAGFSPQEFEMISWMTGWALCGHGSSKSSSDGEEIESDAQENPQHHEQPPSKDEVPEEIHGHVHDVGLRGGDFNGNFWRGLSVEYRMAIGAKCKRLIDEGRWQWLKDLSWNAQLVEYVSAKVSPENKLLVVVPRVDVSNSGKEPVL